MIFKRIHFIFDFLNLHKSHKNFQINIKKAGIKPIAKITLPTTKANTIPIGNKTIRRI